MLQYAARAFPYLDSGMLRLFVNELGGDECGLGVISALNTLRDADNMIFAILEIEAKARHVLHSMDGRKGASQR